MATEEKAEGTAAKRRSLGGMVVDKQTQFKMAVACASLILLPALITSIAFVADLGVEAQSMADAGSSSTEIAAALGSNALTYGFIIVAVFGICSAVSVVLSLRLSNGMIGPVHRLEEQVEKMLNGRFEEIPPLRRTDYLKNLGELLNKLASRSTERAGQKN